MKHFTLGLLSFICLLSACVPQQKYLDLEKEKKNLEQEVTLLDSVANSREQVANDLLEMETDLAKAYKEIEGLRSTNIGLNQSYQELLMRYSSVVNQNNQIVDASSDRQGNLQQELSTQRMEMSERERRITQIEQTLQQRESRVQFLEQTYSKDVASRDQKILQLQNEIYRRDQQLQQLKFSVNSNLGGLNLQGVDLDEKNGRLYLSLSQELLFQTGSAYLGSNGKNALQRISAALKANPGIVIEVEGHTDNQGQAQNNWQLSLNRAMSVSNALISYGISPNRLRVSGKGQYAPIAPNTSEAGRAQNRRTEIILIPQDEQQINNLLYRQ